MTRIAEIVLCKKCRFEIRSDWHFCPSCGDKIVCPERAKKTATSPNKK